jgi:hypothetical protein
MEREILGLIFLLFKQEIRSSARLWKLNIYVSNGAKEERL